MIHYSRGEKCMQGLPLLPLNTYGKSLLIERSWLSIMPWTSFLYVVLVALRPSCLSVCILLWLSAF